MSKFKINHILIIAMFVFSLVDYPSYGENQSLNFIDQNSSIMPYFTYITAFSSNLQISSDGEASITVFVSSRNCDRIGISTFLQKYENGIWTTQKNWTSNQNGTVATLDEKFYISRGYQYRIQSNCEIFNNNSLIERESISTTPQFY